MTDHTPGTHSPQTPHQGQPLTWGGPPPQSADRAVILVHGRGGSAEDILGLGEQLSPGGLCLVAPTAHANTWYPYRFLEPTERNEPWLSSGLRVLDDLEALLAELGFGPERVFLVGFSQGACLLSESLRRRPRSVAGLLAYAGGVIGPVTGPPGRLGSLVGVPALLACGDADPHIPAGRVRETAGLFARMGAQTDIRLYAGMGHGINSDGLKAGQALLAGGRSDRHSGPP